MPDEPEGEVSSLKPSVAHPGHQPDTTGGGSAFDGSSLGLRLDAVNANNQPTLGKRPGISKLSNPPHYELIVVPNKTDATTDGKPDAVDHAVSKGLAGSSDHFPITLDSSTTAGSKSASAEFISRPTSPQKASSRSPPTKDSDSEIEKGSLLSEDPDDEDAIPEWLMFDD